MNTDREISMHYSRGDLLARLTAALIADGVDPDHLDIEALAPYDQFHGRGLEATIEITGLVQFGSTDHILDVGSGIGGPARYFAGRHGCRVTGLDLTAEFCDVARRLTLALDLEDKAAFAVGDAVAMPFAESSFDGAYSMNVSMNIADKSALYGEVHRVLKPGAWLVLSEIARGKGQVEFPTPWAKSAHTSYLSTPEETRSGLEAAGFDVIRLHDTIAEARAFGARSRAMVERGEKPPTRAVTLIHGEIAPQAIANTARGLSEGRIIPIEVLGRKR